MKVLQLHNALKKQLTSEVILQNQIILSYYNRKVMKPSDTDQHL